MLKSRGPPSAAREGSRPFMPDWFLSVAQASADRLHEPKNPLNAPYITALDGDRLGIIMWRFGQRLRRLEQKKRPSLKPWRPLRIMRIPFISRLSVMKANPRTEVPFDQEHNRSEEHT